VLADVELAAPLRADLRSLQLSNLAYDSRRATAGTLFFAFPGSNVDGRQFASDAMSKGAVAVVSELEAPAGFAGPWIQVKHGRRALATAALNFYDHPDHRVAMTGITGTNGKTTTALLVDSLLQFAGRKTALIGTIAYHVAGEQLPAANTTPESLEIVELCARLDKLGGTNLTMEVSSHALALGRAYGIQFHTAVFTNLTRDHLDFHGTMENYAAAKRLLFAPERVDSPRWSVLNADDEWSAVMRPRPGAAVMTYGIDKTADLRATTIRSGFDGLRFQLNHPSGTLDIQSRLAGRINVYNILAAAGAGLTLGLTPEQIAEGIAQAPGVPGRFERIDEGQPFLVVVDYAHTDDAIRNVIRVARGVSQGRVITLFGCGGDRDRAKRPLMGMAAAELSDYVVVTSDNPRSEDPLMIINDALVGVRRFDTPHAVEPDRHAAIRIAMAQAQPGDVVILAGKGHETYQVLRDRTIHLDDREEARATLRELGYGGPQ
jgi:UDP-N-acetylmuramoyl-L-alanyl-D-glutamate--2,6-diaminopimelate ligase